MTGDAPVNESSLPHDITLDVSSTLDALTNAETIHDMRTPALDLDRLRRPTYPQPGESRRLAADGHHRRPETSPVLHHIEAHGRRGIRLPRRLAAADPEMERPVDRPG